MRCGGKNRGVPVESQWTTGEQVLKSTSWQVLLCRFHPTT